LTAIALVRVLDYADLPGHFIAMKLVAVCRVRNEVDIVEAFVRHHCAYFHKLIVLDDGSTDQTLQVLRALQADGLPVVVLSSRRSPTSRAGI
jgi:glycosyltransferase involved in cell wall biosynthesis